MCLLEGEKRWKMKYCNQWGALVTSWVKINGGGKGTEEDEKGGNGKKIDCKRTRAAISPLSGN